MRNRRSGPSTNEETKTNLPITIPLRITGIHRIHSSKDQPSPPIIIVPHKGTSHTATPPNTTHRMHHNGCKIWPFQWISAALGPSIAEGEDKETLGEEEASTITNLPPASKAMPQT